MINQRPKPVGLCTDITLSRRAQLAVLAHIRHTHTRYDSLLKETTWQNARKVVEALCLDHLVKWRGDEETGRDQLDEILQEVVVISDSDSEESEGEDEGETEESSPDVVIDRVTPVAEQGRLNPLALPAAPQGQFPVTSRPPQYLAPAPAIHRSQDHAAHTPRRTTARRENRGFQRYRAWEEAIRRNRDDDEDEDHVRQPPPPRAMDTTASRTPWQYRPADGGPRPVTVIGEAGTVPHSNGFVQPRPFPGPAPHANPPPRPLAHDAPMYPAPERVPAPARHPARYVSPDRLQDFLVRSIEPASPESTMAPSFVRTLPPRQYPVVSAAAPAPYRPVSASPPRDVAMHGEPPADWYRGNPTPVYRQDPPPIRYADPRPPPAVVMNAPPPQRATYNPNPPVVGATPVAAARPQFRMEDRGGFLERVPLEAPPVLYRHPPEAYTDRQYGQPEWQRPVPVYQGQAYAGQPPLRQEYAARQE